MRWFMVALGALIWATAFSQTPKDLETLVQQLQSPDNETRRQAVERAPELGAALIPRLPPLLTHQDWRVQRAAQLALEGIATRATRLPAPNRAEVVKALLTLTKPDQPLSVRKSALWALRICGTDEAVPTLATLLNDAQVQNDALNALRSIGTPAVAKAVAAAAQKAKGAWLRALLATLGEMGHPDGVSVLLTALQTGDAETKAVAATALGRIGDARAITPLVAAVRQGVPSAYDALVRTGELLLQRRQTAPAAIAFEQAFRLAKSEHERCAALVGLGKTGTAKALPILVDALDAPEPTVRAAAEEALIAYRHPDASRGFAQMFQRANPTERAALLQVLVKRRDPNAGRLLQQAAKEAHLEVRLAALTLMGQVDDPALERTLWETVLKGDEKTATVAMGSYLSLAEQRVRTGKSELARTMFEQALRVADQRGWTEWRNRALNGLALLGDPQSLPVVQRYLEQPQPPTEALMAALSIANTLLRQGKREESVALAQRVMQLSPPREVGLRAGQLLQRAGEDPTVTPRRAGFLVHWWLLGPLPNPDNRAFDRAFIDETGVPDVTAPVRVGNRTLRWREYRVFDPQGVVVLNDFFSDNDWVACYAYTEFTVEQEMDAELRIGSDDSVKVWLNGKLVHQFGGMRGLSIDQDRVRVRLQKGVNRLLLKVTQGGGGWEFCVRLVDLSGRPLLP